MIPLLDRRLLFVTGKGGVGKTSVAAALAQEAATAGKRVLVSDLDGRGDLAPLFSLSSLRFTPTQVRGGPAVMSMDTEASLAEYLRLQMRMPVFGRLGPVAAAFDFVATAAPGVREILRVGKFAYEVREDHYDLVVIDAPASGHVVGHLAAAEVIHDIVRLGPVRAQTEWMIELLDDPAVTGTVVVATPEEMPITETIELRERLATETQVDLAAIAVNRIPVPVPIVPADPEAAGRFGPGTATVIESVDFLAARRRLAVTHLDRLRTAAPPTPVLELPEVDGVGPGPDLVAALAGELRTELDR